MWSGGSRRRPPNPPRGSARTRKQGAAKPGAFPARGRAVQAKPTAGMTAWRRMRQRLRAIWRWVVVRTVRSWFSGKPRPELGAELGEVKQFPQGRWQ